MAKVVFLPLFFLLLSFSSRLWAQQNKGLDPKVKVMLASSGYGFAGGTLLGIASLAFGTRGRSVARGASLGLYGGILFGLYLVYGQRLVMDLSNSSGEGYQSESAPMEPMDIDEYRFWVNPSGSFSRPFSSSRFPSKGRGAWEVQWDFFRLSF